MLNDSLFEDTISIIKNWTPEKQYSDEKGYHDDLIDVIREEINQVNNTIFGRQNRVSVTKENGRSLCDIGINREIGIELKKDLNSKSKVDRLVGQIQGFKKDYQDLIIVLVGKTDKESLEGIKDRISDLTRNSGFGFNKEPRIRIIEKSSNRKDVAKKEITKKNTSSQFPDITNLNIKQFGLNLYR